MATPLFPGSAPDVNVVLIHHGAPELVGNVAKAKALQPAAHSALLEPGPQKDMSSPHQEVLSLVPEVYALNPDA